MIHKFTVEIETDDPSHKVEYVLRAQVEDLTNGDDEWYDDVTVTYEESRNE